MLSRTEVKWLIPKRDMCARSRKPKEGNLFCDIAITLIDLKTFQRKILKIIVFTICSTIKLQY